MMNNLTDTYLYKALDAYPYDLPEAIESLNYALSADDKNPIALRLMGQIYADQLNDYETAKAYYEEAIAEDLYSLTVYRYYIDALVKSEDYDKADKLIDFALTIKGMDKAIMHFFRGLILEYKLKYMLAIKAYKVAKTVATNDSFISSTNNDIKRVKEKMPKKKKKKATKSKAKAKAKSKKRNKKKKK